MAVFSVLYAIDELDRYMPENGIEGRQYYLVKIMVLLMTVLPVLFIPLFHLISDRTTNRVNWSIKTSIFHEVLDQYKTDYKIIFKGVLPEKDLKKLNLENGFTKFAYGDDLIFGYINSVYFRMSEIHSVQFTGKSFKGLVCAVIPELNQKLNLQTDLIDSASCRIFR
jgi:hypothetical protein